MSGGILHKLEASRRDLLELGLRNPLINFRKRKRGIEVVDELSLEVFRILVAEKRTMSFAALPKGKAEVLGEDESSQANLFELAELLGDPEEEDNDGPAARHVDNKLQTWLKSEDLNTRLLQIHSLARTSIEETGVNTLYLALGFLHWYESDSSQEERMAPLVVVPVELKRADARERYKVQWTGEDIGANLSLQAKLLAEFGIALPDIDPEQDFDLAAYFDAVEETIAGQFRWRVERDEIHLCFLSFGKFLMYKDLNLDGWPDPEAAANHPILSALLGEGFREPNPPLTEHDHLDEHLAPDQVHCVVDADSTQMLAIIDANSGRNLVIEGPPGTGKSQTITNIIAEAVGQGRKVLFVSEKMAALEVVKRRLDEVGLGDAVLELHSHKAQKRAVLDELKRTLDLSRPQINDAEDELRTLTRMRDQLNAYAAAVNEPLPGSGVRPIEALGQLLDFKESGRSLPRFDFSEMENWSQADYKDRRTLVAAMARKLDEMGCPSDNPFWGTRLKVFNPIEQDQWCGHLEEALRLTRELRAAAEALAKALRLPAPQGPADVQVLCRAAQRAIEAPHQIDGIALKSADWQARRDDLRKLIEAGQRIRKLRTAHGDTLIEEAWDQDLLDVRQALVHYGNKWWRLLSGQYRAARARLAGLCRQGLPSGNAACLALVDAVLEARRHQKVYQQYQSLGEALFRAQWQGLDSDWQVLGTLVDWVVALYRDIGEGTLPQGLIDFLAGSPQLDRLQSTLDAVKSLLASQSEATAEAMKAIAFVDADTVLPTDFDGLQKRLEIWQAQPEALQRMTEFNLLADELQQAGLVSGVALASTWRNAGTDYLMAFEWTWYEGQFDIAYRTRPPLQRFDRTSHEHAIETFQKLDTALFQHTRRRLMLKHWEALPSIEGAGELSIVRREINKKRRHLPIRRLMEQAGRAIQAIKPVFMMSPMSIATYLPPGRIEFDLVIFDEASQVAPVDAFGALLRGKQAVVVGDSKQMPPSSFFDKLYSGEEDDEDNITADQESILGMFRAQGAPRRMLRWHYRSRHESLIAVSNHEFYENRLVVFPSPGVHPAATGLKFHLLEDTYYDRGRTRTNPEEALAVAKRVMAHAKTHPQHSLGVVAFSVAQRDAIEMQLEALRRQDPSAEDFFNAHPSEPFFIKNLENVQGDERDVILISIGYGKTKEGYLAYNFGPLNSEGGERRLNVLITRARLACEVFANFTGDDIDLRRTNARGVIVLKNFLNYAQNRVLLTPQSTGRGPDSPFEEAVLRCLQQAGYDAEPQVGCAGFFIDIGIRDPDKPGRYLLGVECDGATYHSARSARDRDRLREEVLRKLGWRLHRIWSTDWFRNPDREFKRLEEAIERARLTRQEVPAAPARAPQTIEIVRTDETKTGEAAAANSADAYSKANFEIAVIGQQLHQVSPVYLATWLREVVDAESPIHIDAAQVRVANAAGVRRLGTRIKAALDAGVEYAVREGMIERRGDFLWKPGMSEVPVRDRSHLKSSEKKIEFIAPEEIQAAIRLTVTRNFSINRDDLLSESLNLLGFKRVTGQARERVETLLDELVRNGELNEQGLMLLPVST